MVESRRFSDDSVRIGRAGENLQSVTRRIGEIDGMNQSVATATEEQNLGGRNLNMDITEINVLNQDGVRNLEASLRACTELDQQAGRLKAAGGQLPHLNGRACGRGGSLSRARCVKMMCCDGWFSPVLAPITCARWWPAGWRTAQGRRVAGCSRR